MLFRFDQQLRLVENTNLFQRSSHASATVQNNPQTSDDTRSKNVSYEQQIFNPLKDLADFQLLSFSDKEEAQFMNTQRLENVRFLKINANLLNYLRCFPKVFCVQIVGYTGQSLFSLPLSTRILILRDCEQNIDFTGNVAMIQTKNVFKVTSAFFEKFREKGVIDISECELRDLFMLGIEKT